MNPDLLAFIVRAKANTWNSDAPQAVPSRPGSHDLAYSEGSYAYVDSYVGSIAFVGQEVVWIDDVPVWAMNYRGQVLRPDLYSGSRAGVVSQFGRGCMYELGTFLGSHAYDHDGVRFCMESVGDVLSFRGSEWHELDGICVYRFDLHGGYVEE